MLNTEAIRPGLAPKDGNWGFNISELEGKFPAGTVDNTVEPVYKEVFFFLISFSYFYFPSGIFWYNRHGYIHLHDDYG